MPTRLCLEPACANPATYRGRCQNCNRASERRINRAGHAIYRTKRWANTRDAYLFEHPLCECSDPRCEAVATDVHHHVDIETGGDPWDFTNLQALSHACHSRITRARQVQR